LVKDPEVAQIRRRRITDAAAGLFETHGFDAVTVDQIAAQAECTKRTLYTRYASKEAIRLAIVAEEFENFAAFAAGVAQKAAENGRDTREAGDAIVQYQVLRHRTAPYRARAALAFALEPQDADLLRRPAPGDAAIDERRSLLARIVAATDRLEAATADLIAWGQRSGGLRADLDPAVAGLTLWAAIAALVRLTTAKAADIEARFGVGQEAFLDAGLDAIWNGLVPRTASTR
jgi:AcrR family transcriptional regulator